MTKTVFLNNFPCALVRSIVTVWDKKTRRAMGYICSKSKFQCLHVCKHWNLDFGEMYPNARLFLTPTNKGLSRSLFCAKKIFAQIWNNLSKKWNYVKAIIFASILFVSVLFVPYVLCSNFGWSITALVEYQKQFCLFCGEKKRFLSVSRKKLGDRSWFHSEQCSFLTQTLSSV